MSQGIRIAFENAMPSTLEAMFVAGREVLRPHRIVFMLLSLMTTVLVCAGGAGIFFTVGVIMTGQSEPAIHFVWIGALAAAGFTIFAQRWPSVRFATAMTKSGYGARPQWAHFDSAAMTFGNDHAEWRTQWQAVDNIVLGKKGLVLSVAAIAFVVPITAIDDPDTLKTQLKAWKDNA